MKKILISLMIITMLIFAMSGCSDDKTPTNNNQQAGNTSNQTTEKPNNDNTSSSKTNDKANEHTETKVLEDIQLSDQRGGKAWKYDMGTDGSKISISAGYTVDTDYVYDITISVKVNKENSVYEEFKSDLIKYEKQLTALNDDEITVSFRETEDGVEFFALFDGLEYADREKRIAMAEEVIGGITANDSDTTFRFSEIDSELKAIGFVYGA